MLGVNNNRSRSNIVTGQAGLYLYIVGGDSVMCVWVNNDYIVELSNTQLYIS